jgi:fatty-acyl-CoA synthase
VIDPRPFGEPRMRALMQDEQLLLTRIMERAADYYPATEIVTRTPSGSHRETYRQLADRAAQLAGALRSLGVRPSDRVATLGSNTWRHLELYFAVPCMGAVLHTLNVRLLPDQLAWICNQAEDKILLFDSSLSDLVEQMAPSLKTVKDYVEMGSGDELTSSLAHVYDDLLSRTEPEFAWPDLDERTACAMCYTSGTTGHPKGVVYSHRSMVLHTYVLNQPSVHGLSDRDVVLPVVPMFHANGWGLPYAAALAGAKQVYSGVYGADPGTIATLIEEERVTVAAGVPTVWVGFQQYLREHPTDTSSVRAIPCGGSAVPGTLIESFEREFGLSIWQGWGMTETSPQATFGGPSRHLDLQTEEERNRLRATQGRPIPGIRLRVVDMGTGGTVPWDDKTPGEVQVRGPWVASSYYRLEDSGESFQDGWLRTGDVAVVTPTGEIRLVDRIKDLLKSGGEWISSIELETLLMSHPDVLEAAVVGAPDVKWGERPVAYLALRPGSSLSPEAVRDYIKGSIPKWWMPDSFVFVDAIPKTSVGKFDKRLLRSELIGS